LGGGAGGAGGSAVSRAQLCVQYPSPPVFYPPEKACAGETGNPALGQTGRPQKACGESCDPCLGKMDCETPAAPHACTRDGRCLEVED
jgi:hypothetical protein